MAGLIKRGRVYYAQYRIAGREKRVSLDTESIQVAKEKIRQLESRLARGDEILLPTKTPISDIVSAYVEHIRTVKTKRSVVTDLYYLREEFGPVCDALKIKSRKGSEKARKRRLKPGTDRRHAVTVIEAPCFEQITTAQISEFIAALVRSRGLAPKTANRHREVLTRLFNWSMKQRGVRIASGQNPAAPVERYAEPDPEIRFLTLNQVEEQLNALAPHPQLQAMVAVYIYGGLRREEALWLQMDDLDFTNGPFGIIRIRPKTFDGESWKPKTGRNRAVPISDIVSDYVEHIRTVKTKRGVVTDLYYLREEFGPVCDALKIKSRKGSEKARKRRLKPGTDRRHAGTVIEAPCFEQITTAQISEFIAALVRARGLASLLHPYGCCIAALAHLA